LNQLRSALEGEGGTVTDGDSEALSVRGLSQERIGELAWSNGIMLHELATQSASLEEAFVESTEGNLEFSGGTSSRSESPKGGAQQ
jgi:ABC-2 type transport system ATP-binding protein